MNNSNIKISIDDEISSGNLHPIFYKYFYQGIPEHKRAFLDKRIGQFNYSIEFVKMAEGADFIMPRNFFKSLNSELKEKLVKKSKEYNGKMIVSLFGDGVADLEFEKGIVLKNSVWKSKLNKNEIVVPPYSEDLSENFIPRKKSKEPTIGFCGQTSINNGKLRFKNNLKNLIYNILFFFTRDKRHLYRKRGIILRKKLINNLNGSSRVKTNFIERNFFAGHQDTTAGHPVTDLKNDFIKNIIDSDFVLAPKGDGNYSNRFYETLSCGRFPVVPDTDFGLPLEKEIDYSRIMVRVPYFDVQNTEKYILDFYNSMTEKEWLDRQNEAVSVYRRYLRYDSFFNSLFLKLMKH